MALKNTIQAITLGNITLSSDVDFEPVFTNGLPVPCFALRIINNTAAAITISYDGVNAHDFVFNDSSINVPPVYGVQPNNFTAQFPAGMQIYAMGPMGSNVIVAGYYQPKGDS